MINAPRTETPQFRGYFRQLWLARLIDAASLRTKNLLEVFCPRVFLELDIPTKDV